MERESFVCLDQHRKDDQEKEAMTESTAVSLSAAALEEQGWFFKFPATRIRGKHPDSFTPREIAEMTEDELKDYRHGLAILYAVRAATTFLCDDSSNKRKFPRHVPRK